MSSNELTEEVAEELRLLAHKLAEDIREDADAASGARSTRSARVTKSDITSAWLQLSLPPEPLSVRVAKGIKFAMMTLTLGAIIFLVFELTAKSLTGLESAAVVIVTIGFLYMLVNVAISVRRLFSSRTDNDAQGTISIYSREALPEKENPSPVSSLTGFLDKVLHDEKLTSRLAFLIRQLSFAVVGILAAVAGFIYLGIHEFASELQYIIAFGSALLLALTRLTMRSLTRQRKKKK